MSVTTKLETITPTKAQKWLDNRAPNRPIRPKAVKRLAAAIRQDEWEVNGETVKFDKDGRMIDGQHRCLGVVQSGVVVKSFVTRGLNRVTFDTIDTGNPRLCSDLFARYNEKHYCTLAAAVSWLSRFNAGAILAGRRTAPTHPQSRALLAQHPGLRESCVWGGRVKDMIAPSAGVFLHYLFSRTDSAAADFFFEHFATGDDLKSSSRYTSAILALRGTLQKNRADVARMPTEVLVGLTIQAWNTMRAGRVVKRMRPPKDGYTRDNFPEVK